MLNRPNPMPNTSLLTSLAWVHTMPQGAGRTPTILGGPVVEYQTRTVKERTSGNSTEVVEWLYAEIKKNHLNRGTEPNKRMRQWVQNEVGVKDDQAGHIVANRLGGVGTEKWNIFPQNANMNMGTNRADIEDMIYTLVELHGSLKVWYHFVYDDAANPGRPGMLQFYYQSPQTGDHNDDLLNPLSLADARASV